MLRRAEAERVVAAGEHEIDSCVGEEPPDVALTAPERRRRGVGLWPRRVVPDDASSSPIRLSGSPVEDADQPSWPADARELARGYLVPRRELDAERRQHAVEAIVLEAQVLGVALDPGVAMASNRLLRSRPRAARFCSRPVPGARALVTHSFQTVVHHNCCMIHS
jgi:hypothetical protein